MSFPKTGPLAGTGSIRGFSRTFNFLIADRREAQDWEALFRVAMANSPHINRERGFALVGRLNRWIAAGAVILSGSLSVAAANAFHGRTRGQTSAAAVSHHSGSSGGSSNTSSSGGSSNSGGSAGDGSSDSGGGGLQPPAQAPSAAPAAPSGGVVSGGS